MDVFVLWDMNADSWTGTRTFKGVYSTQERAEADIPDAIKTETYKRPLYGAYVSNYTYMAVEKLALIS